MKRGKRDRRERREGKGEDPHRLVHSTPMFEILNKMRILQRGKNTMCLLHLSNGNFPTHLVYDIMSLFDRVKRNTWHAVMRPPAYTIRFLIKQASFRRLTVQ